MRCRNLYMAVTPMLVFLILLCVNSSLYAGAVLFHGKTADVDLSDLETYSGDPDETAVRAICAEIVKRYHDKGYTAFFIKRAVRGSDGILEIYFHESVVGRVRFAGGDNADDISSDEIYTAGTVFNEFLLEDNIDLLKRKYMLHGLKVDVTRDSNGSVILDVYPEKSRFTLDVYIAGDPLRGMIPSVTAGYIGDYLNPEITVRSSFGQGDVTLNSAEIRMKRSGVSSGFIIGAGAEYSDESFDAEGSVFYRSLKVSADAGWFYSGGPYRFELLLSGSAYSLDDYPAADTAYMFPFRFKAVYDDRAMGLDRNDYIFSEFQCSAGWNTMEETAYASYDFYSKISIPLFWRFSAFLTAESFFTTGDERLFNRYVFTGLLSCRVDDYTAAQGVHSAGTGITIELMRDHIYVSPGFYAGAYEDEDGTYSRAECAGADILWDSGAIVIDFSVMKEITGPGDVVYRVSAGGRF
ncbi:MAG TPA: hypothetical protein PK514_13595 [Spirochaetota bacterium]|nr:hypothetical protein [Spirochaetota bacterium]